MPLSSDIRELLSGFEKRMKIINITRCLLDYSCPQNIRDAFPDRNEAFPNRKILDNIIVAVLVFIKDKTLSAEQKCTIEDVASFLECFFVLIPDLTIDPQTLARYIVVNVLQNGGELMEFTTFYSETESFAPMPIRLLNEEKGQYHLTDDAFDYLFRTKEIESELDYSVTRFRMKEHLKKDNYKGALEESRELLSRIRNLKLRIDDFILHCRENIFKLAIDEYESILNSVHILLEDEHKELLEIQKSINERISTLKNAHNTGLSSTDTKKNRDALNEIIENINQTINEHRILSNKKGALKTSYSDIIKDNFSLRRYERMDFEKDLMVPLRKTNNLGDVAKYLLFILTKPELEKVFSIENFYMPQSKLAKEEADTGFDLTCDNIDYKGVIEAKNQRYVHIMRDLLRFAGQHDNFNVSDFVDSLTIADLKDYCIDKALPNVIMTLYSLHKLDIEEWKQGQRIASSPNGEFDPAWCLAELPYEYLRIKAICFLNPTNKTFSFSSIQDEYELKIDMTNFNVEVIR